MIDSDRLRALTLNRLLTDRDKAQHQRDNFERIARDARELQAKAIKRADALAAENERYREALAFYAEPESWKQPSVWSPGGGEPSSDAEADGGMLARDALAASPAARSEGDPAA